MQAFIHEIREDKIISVVGPLDKSRVGQVLRVMKHNAPESEFETVFPDLNKVVPKRRRYKVYRDAIRRGEPFREFLGTALLTTERMFEISMRDDIILEEV